MSATNPITPNWVGLAGQLTSVVLDHGDRSERLLCEVPRGIWGQARADSFICFEFEMVVEFLI